jgi:hypothetical protein
MRRFGIWISKPSIAKYYASDSSSLCLCKNRAICPRNAPYPRGRPSIRRVEKLALKFRRQRVPLHDDGGAQAAKDTLFFSHESDMALPARKRSAMTIPRFPELSSAANESGDRHKD